MADYKRKCFIITPIGDEKDSIRRHIEGIIDAVIMPVMENDYDIQVAHRLFEMGSINKQIMELIYKSDLVIANLTGTNPNVMYELAFRHTLGLPVITIAEKGTKLPFDVSTERTIFYTNDLHGVIDIQKELKRYLSQIDFDSGRTSGPIHDYLDSVELKNLIFRNNKNKDTAEILELIVKRLETIENTIPNIKKEISSELVNDVLKTAIKQTPDLNIAKLNMNVIILNEKIIKINDVVFEYSERLAKRMFTLIDYVKNNSLKGMPNISSDIFISNLNECIELIDKFKNTIEKIVNNE